MKLRYKTRFFASANRLARAGTPARAALMRALDELEAEREIPNPERDRVSTIPPTRVCFARPVFGSNLELCLALGFDGESIDVIAVRIRTS
jgi:hypothetical protein